MEPDEKSFTYVIVQVFTISFLMETHSFLRLRAHSLEIPSSFKLFLSGILKKMRHYEPFIRSRSLVISTEVLFLSHMKSIFDFCY